MSDRPPNPTDTGANPPSKGGWTQPSSPAAAWEPVERPQAESGWKVSVLPSDIKEQPAEAGAWHLPSPEDTQFTAEDEIEISESRRPEDELLEIAALVSGEMEAEAAPKADDAPVAPEDLIYLIEHTSDDDEPNNPQMSELIALASLVEDESGQFAATDADMAALTVAPDDADDEPAQEQLSAAERLVMNTRASEPATTAGEVIDADDPAAVARRALEQLSRGDTLDAEVVGDTDSMGATMGTADADPASYAAERLRQLGMDAPPGGVTAPSQPVDEPLDPRQVELGRKFAEVEARVRNLRQQMQTGQINEDSFINQLRDMMILDDAGNWWMMGVETDTWYKSENNAWVEAHPEPLSAYRESQQQQTGASQFNRVDDSLPYFTEDQPVQQPTGNQGGQGIRLDENFMPLPQDAPINDLDATVAGPSAFATSQDYAQETVPGQSYYQPTRQAEAAPYGTIAAPYEEAQQPPDYSLDEEDRGEVFEKAAERQRRQRTGVFITVAVIAVVAVLAMGVLFFFLSSNWYSDIANVWQPRLAAITDTSRPTLQTVTILSSNGTEIASIPPEGDDRRPLDSLDEVSPYFIHALLALEDPDYFATNDTLNGFSAYFSDLTSSLEYTGSPITVAVINNLVVTPGTPPPTASELAVIASELEDTYSKDTVLLAYINEILFFANQTYGIEAAAQFYFDKSAVDLNIVESAMLATISEDPQNYEPVNNRQLVFDVKDATMLLMGETGCLQIRASGQELCVSVEEANPEGGVSVANVARVEAREFRSREFDALGDYPHFVTFVLDELSRVYGNDHFIGGYEVTTTLNIDLQNTAQDFLRSRVRQLAENGVNTGAVMITDPRTGAVAVMVGSPDYDDDEVNGSINYARAGNEPGSLIQPIIYATALRGADFNGNGLVDFGEYYTPASILWDIETTFNGYRPPSNGAFRGPISTRRALQNDYNIPAVQAYNFIGADAFRTVAGRLGLTLPENADLSLPSALGTNYEVTLYNLMAAYGTFANNGEHLGLYTIDSIVDANGVAVPTPPRSEPQQVLGPAVNYLMQSMLSDDTARSEVYGVGSSLTLPEFGTQPVVAAKAGTSREDGDLWTLGFTRNWVVGMWMGTYNDQPVVNNLTGATAVAPVWQAIVRAALDLENPSAFQPPSNGTVTTQSICPQTGAINGPCGVALRSENFADGRTPPDATVPGQGLVQDVLVDTWTGLRANENCPFNQQSVTYTNIQYVPAVNWINSTQQGQQYARSLGLPLPAQPVPSQACDLNTAQPTTNISQPAPSAVIQGQTYEIRGQVLADNFQRYEIQVASAGTENYQIITSSTQQQTAVNSLLATWDTTGFDNGEYTLRLAAFRQGGGFAYETMPFTINNPIPTPTPIPTNTPAPPTVPPIPTQPIPFDNLGDAGSGDAAIPLEPLPTFGP